MVAQHNTVLLFRCDLYTTSEAGTDLKCSAGRARRDSVAQPSTPVNDVANGVTFNHGLLPCQQVTADATCQPANCTSSAVPKLSGISLIVMQDLSAAAPAAGAP
jgi:hypothetical protein